MKKHYFFLAACMGLMFNSSAQFTDDIESYDEGPIFNEYWSTWDSNDDGAQNAIVSTTYAASGTKSVFFDVGVGAGGPQDCILKLGDGATSGAWSVSWQMYVPTGNSAYFNLQGNVVPSANANTEFVSGNITFNAGNAAPGTGGDDNADGLSTFTFPHDQWFEVIATVNFGVGNGIYSLTIDGVETAAAPIGAGITTWGGIDFFAADTANGFYVDDVNFYSNPTGIDAVADASFSVYPNPAQDVLNVASAVSGTSVVIYSALGKIAKQITTTSELTTLDISDLSSGAYYVRMTSGDVTKTVKVIKQ